MVLVLPLYPGGTLQVQINERGTAGLRIQEVRWIAAQMALALEALHDMRVIHRDVKPQNILLRADGYYALTDFGLAARLDEGVIRRVSTRELAGEKEGPNPKNKAGTKGYWAPEVIRKEPQSETADWWSLGVVLSYAASGTHPFKRRRGSSSEAKSDEHEMSDAEVNEKTLTAPIELGRLESATDEQSAQMRAMLHGLLERDASSRLGAGGAKEVRDHPFIAEHMDLPLLKQQLLCAPWVPNASLVYASNNIDFFSEQDDEATPGAPHAVDGWDYCCGSEVYSLELRELARKNAAESILSTDEILEISPDAPGRLVVAPSPWAVKMKRVAVRRNMRSSAIRCATTSYSGQRSKPYPRNSTT